MDERANQRACIHCRDGDGLEPVPITERGKEIGFVYCCTGCRLEMQGCSMDIIFYNTEENGPQLAVH